VILLQLLEPSLRIFSCGVEFELELDLLLGVGGVEGSGLSHSRRLDLDLECAFFAQEVQFELQLFRFELQS
jgi:hypothetical protein